MCVPYKRGRYSHGLHVNPHCIGPLRYFSAFRGVSQLISKRIRAYVDIEVSYALDTQHRKSHEAAAAAVATLCGENQNSKSN